MCHRHIYNDYVYIVFAKKKQLRNTYARTHLAGCTISYSTLLLVITSCGIPVRSSDLLCSPPAQRRLTVLFFRCCYSSTVFYGMICHQRTHGQDRQDVLRTPLPICEEKLIELSIVFSERICMAMPARPWHFEYTWGCFPYAKG